MAVRRSHRLLVVVVNLAGAVAGVLAFLAWRQPEPPPSPTRLEGSITEGFYERVDDVGYMPKPGKRVTVRKLAGDRVIFDVVYTIDAEGFRVGPAAANPVACVLLFGDSFTFGEGVSDDEAYPAQIVRMSGGRVATRNLGVIGWGPHQFLAGLQSGRFQRAVDCRPTHAVFLMIPTHIHRSIHAANSWDVHGPRYRLAGGRPVRDGNFDDPEGFNWRRLLGWNAVSDQQAVALTVALIAEAAGELRRRYPGIDVQIMSWQWGPDELSDMANRQLTSAGLAPRMVEAIIPRYGLEPDKYTIDPAFDRHPNPLAYRLTAAYVLREIVRVDVLD